MKIKEMLELPIVKCSLVRTNLIEQKGYSPYCGNYDSCSMPRTFYREGQFHCPICYWTSEFPKEFMDLYHKRWNIPTPDSK